MYGLGTDAVEVEVEEKRKGNRDLEPYVVLKDGEPALKRGLA